MAPVCPGLAFLWPLPTLPGRFLLWASSAAVSCHTLGPPECPSPASERRPPHWLHAADPLSWLH